MTKSIKQLSVRLYGKEVGILKEHSGRMSFTYNEDAQTPLSLSLPLCDEPYSEKYCRGYFGGLLPESESTRRELARKYKINEKNDFALLAAIGGECAGAVSFYPIGEPEHPEIKEIRADFLSEEELDEHIRSLPKKPMSFRRLSLAGAQEKTAVCIVDGEIGLPQDGSPSTHILKPAPLYYEQLVFNEYL